MHATEMKTKRHYTAPVTQRATVELEGGFCSSITNDTNTVNVTSHEVGKEYDFNGETQQESFGVSWE